ncbi:MAG TPA: peptidase S41 [Rhodospirillaceae bacterium]|nr:MAG: peptidase S41 [Alphaproteobacteria bacterium GWF2_58_20]HAU29534.1 peptidase S41 [Rhodospirillaceae bacterium]
MRKISGMMFGVALCFAGSALAVDADVNPAANTYEQLDLFGSVFERVRAQYVEEVTDEKLVESAINGMLVALDPHSEFLDQKAFKDMQVQTKGEFGGLGIEVTMENGLVKVVSPIDDTPAERAGVQAGDLIIKLDGEQVMGLSLSDAVDKMRGPVGTDIVITVLRGESGEPFDLTLTRAIIRVKSVRSHVEGDVGYIRVTTFNTQTQPGIQEAFAALEKEKGDKLTGYVLDLRNNPGGLLDQAIAVSDDFLDSGEIVSTRGRLAEDIRRYNATPGDMAKGKPLVVLVNGGSASASEIVAGALQDQKRAILMGTKTFGKGSVQTIVPVTANGDKAIRLTTARYFTPSGRSIQAEGIVPDIEVKPAKLEEIEMPKGYSEADLRGALSNPDKEKTASKDGKMPVKADKKAAEPKKDKDGKDSSTNGKDAEDAPQDYQLMRAIDLVRGINLFQAAVK